MILGLHHTAISTLNLETLKTFYCDLFGLEEVMRFSWDQGDRLCDSIVGLEDSATTFVFLRAGNTYLEIFQYSHPAPRPKPSDWRVSDRGITHICFEVADIHAEYERLSQAGMRFQNDAPIDAMGMLNAVYGFDPDGNIVELIEFPDRQELSGSNSLTGAPLLNGTKALLKELE
jgi:glyoxylase I family protein